MGSNSRPGGGYPMGPWAQNCEKIGKNANAIKKMAGLHSVAPLEPKMGPTWAQLGSQNGAKIAKKPIP